jgi:hypothetical protein
MRIRLRAKSIVEARAKVAALTTLGVAKVWLRAVAGTHDNDYAYWRHAAGREYEDVDVRFDVASRAFVLGANNRKLTPEPGAELTIEGDLPCFVIDDYK